MTVDAAMNLLGLARRAGRMTTGEGFVLTAIRDGSAKLVLLGSDTAKNTTKKISDKSSFYQVPLSTALTREQLSQAIGASRTVVAITDPGFAKKLIKLLT